MPQTLKLALLDDYQKVALRMADWDRLRKRGIEIIKYSDANHRSFPGRHAYVHDADGNALEICYLYESGEGEA